MEICFKPITPVEPVNMNFVVTYNIKNCEVRFFNNFPLDFKFIDNKFKFCYRDHVLTDLKRILNFTKKYGTEDQYLEIEKFIFSCV